jgi:acyl carrier protein
MNDQVRQILAEHGRLSTEIATLGDHDDLYRAGLTSHASVTVMLACEQHFGVEFPQSLIARSTFASVASIVAALDGLGASSVPST